MFRSVLTSPAYLAGVQSGALSSSGGACIAVDPLTLGYLARIALGGSNDNRVAYIWDDLPAAARPGEALTFKVTVRNDGWNALSAGEIALAASVDRVEFVRQHLTSGPAIGASRLNSAGSPLRAGLRRRGYGRVCAAVSV